jgi:DNA-binding GntR family transcriptional regulator
MFLKTHSGDRDVPAEHVRIAEFAMARKVDEARERLRQHIGRTGENVRLALTAANSRRPSRRKVKGTCAELQRTN